MAFSDQSTSNASRRNRVAIYARFPGTGANNPDHSIENQLSTCRIVAMDRGWDVVREFIEEAMVGESERGPVFQTMIQTAKTGEFDTVLTDKPDTFTAYPFHQIRLLQEIIDCGVSYQCADEKFYFDVENGRVARAGTGVRIPEHLIHRSEWSDLSEDLAFRGTDALREGQFQKAEWLLEEALEEDARCVPAYLGQLSLYEQVGESQKLAHCFEQAQKYAPENETLLFGLGTTLIKRGNYHDAIPYLTRAIELNPQDTDALCNLAICLELTERIKEAIEAYHRATRVAPEDPDIRSNLADLYLKLGQNELAVGHCQASIELYDVMIYQATHFYDMQQSEMRPQAVVIGDLLRRKNKAKALLAKAKHWNGIHSVFSRLLTRLFKG